jgi:hypothetical protein
MMPKVAEGCDLLREKLRVVCLFSLSNLLEGIGDTAVTLNAWLCVSILMRFVSD